jgi:protein-S-isoprenylcysteine O-methyltransferase Ste14
MEARKFYAFAVVQIVVGCALLWFIFTAPGKWNLQREAGAALMLIGLGGIAVARLHLGRSFAVRAEAHQLVTRGLYSKIRNPIYVFGTVMIAGFLLILHQPIGWLFFLVMIVVQMLRARREARVLEAAFGDAYRDYRRQTWF